ncbi:MAG: carbamoyltransferase N-terminal domain-containing protein [Candidatus Zixiibacteriota bacterium]
MNILGISCFYHDSAAALVSDGVLIAAAMEERFTGIKHDPSFPKNSISFCLESLNKGMLEIDAVVFYEKPWSKFDRILSSYMQTAPFSYTAFRKAVPLWLKERLWIPNLIRKETGFKGAIYFTEHHQAHAAGAFFSSPFKSAALLTIDGVGEWATAALGRGIDNKVNISQVMHYPHSLGLLYSAITYFLGFRVNSAEYKVMGLAPYGEPAYADLFRQELVKINDDGSIFLNMKYFEFHRGLTMTGKRLEKLLGRPRRLPETELTASDKNIAASIQAIAEEIIIKMAQHARRLTAEKYLCLSGGVSLNCAAAGKLLRSGIFDDIHIQPASSDSGGAAGAALYLYYALSKAAKKSPASYLELGPAYNNEVIIQYLQSTGLPFRQIDDPSLAEWLAEALFEQKIIGLFTGYMEFGPRALGFRSILASPTDLKMKQKINQAVKFREPFRPFAPVVMEEKAADFFDCDRPSPYMLFNFNVRREKAAIIPAVVHVDNTARLQTVNAGQNRRLYSILSEFEKKSGIPVLLNTSLNLRGYPIARTPEDAVTTFASSGIDILALENMILDKAEIDPERLARYRLRAGTD